MRKTQQGTVVSDKMQGTAVVEVTVWKIHRVLKKRYKRHNRFMASNPNNEYKAGDLVEIAETRPMSRHKRWEILGLANAASKQAANAAEKKAAATTKKSKKTGEK